MNMTDAVGHFKTKTKLAKALGISPSAVSMWGESIPHVRQCQIQVITKGRLKADANPVSNPVAA
ncbi:Cro/CI family transcriptional regulator [Pseudomonas sp. C9-3]|uniref:Cro/CI family transcriptional regulator n=1 Tax=Pseudomonas sp. C9-3 TaxID=3078264 RepID=UPI0028E88893|nr:Cro/CI family transcriptional regulator [Pseudomonas sp. C9-3]